MFIWNLTLFNYVIYLVYITNIFVICSLSGFHGQHHSRPDPAAQDIIPESDCEFRGLSHLLASLLDPSLSQGQVETVPVTVARECGVIPEASHEALQAFSFSEMKLYKHAITYKWTADELIATIKLIKSTDFNVEDVNVDLHKRVAAAIAQGHFTSYNM